MFLLSACLAFASNGSAQTWIDLEFHNQTAQYMRVDYELKYFTSNACANPSGSTGWFDACIPDNNVSTLGTWDERYIAQVDVWCDCSSGPVATIYCGDDDVIFQCGLMDQFIMGLSLHGWRVEPYEP